LYKSCFDNTSLNRQVGVDYNEWSEGVIFQIVYLSVEQCLRSVQADLTPRWEYLRVCGINREKI